MIMFATVISDPPLGQTTVILGGQADVCISP